MPTFTNNPTQALFFPPQPLPTEINRRTLKPLIEQFQQQLTNAFQSGQPVNELLKIRANYIDQLLITLWQYYHFDQFNTEQSPISFVAVGGYGRQELHPLSDIDLLILSSVPLSETITAQLSELLSLLWDLKLEVGHSVRTLTECQQEANAELSVVTNLLESRLIIGNAALFQQIKHYVYSDDCWTSEHFFTAKLAEQQERYHRYHGTSYYLEPDIKNSPGGLRDIHILQWVAQRHFGAQSLEEMVTFGFLTATECLELKESQEFLWKIRYALHLSISRYDNRLLFDRQADVARLLGYQGEGAQAIEQMMKEFYRVTRNIAELNQVLLQLFDEAILSLTPLAKPQPLNDHFQLRGTLIDLRDETLFLRSPASILMLFHHLTYQSSITGIYSVALRQLRVARQNSRQLLCFNPHARKLFLEILQHPQATSRALTLMHRYGILSIYLPTWHHIVGQMQFDLYHAYTVDEHILRTLQQIENFTDPHTADKHPLCVELYPKQLKPELLHIAALFHDIAKGRGGDHSTLGSLDVAQFAELHQLSTSDTQLVTWLVRQHLLMSVTAQRQDIHDPIVIQRFAKEMQNPIRMGYLLCLTVADICATNDTLWNNWKRSLLTELYLATNKQFKRGTHNLPNLRLQIQQNKNQALIQLSLSSQHEEKLRHLWSRCRADYLLRHSSQQLAWHAQHLLTHDPATPLILINPITTRGGTEIFIYCQDRPYLFATVAGELDRRNLSVYDAQIFTNRDGMAMDTFTVLEPNGKPIATDRHPTIIQALYNALLQSVYTPPKARKLPPKLRHFFVPTTVNFLPMSSEQRSYLELIALDRPGLLAQVGEIFAELNLSLYSARITTVGKRVEDIFVLSDNQHQALSDGVCQLLRHQLIERL